MGAIILEVDDQEAHLCCEHEYESGCACCTYECKEEAK